MPNEPRHLQPQRHIVDDTLPAITPGGEMNQSGSETSKGARCLNGIDICCVAAQFLIVETL